MFDLLHLFSRSLEDWSDRHHHIIALLEAVSTTSAVLVALWASVTAKRATRPQLTALLGVWQIVDATGKSPDYICIRLTISVRCRRLSSIFFA
jgi:hypothetical protein